MDKLIDRKRQRQRDEPTDTEIHRERLISWYRYEQLDINRLIDERIDMNRLKDKERWLSKQIGRQKHTDR